MTAGEWANVVRANLSLILDGERELLQRAAFSMQVTLGDEVTAIDFSGRGEDSPPELVLALDDDTHRALATFDLAAFFSTVRLRGRLSALGILRHAVARRFGQAPKPPLLPEERAKRANGVRSLLPERGVKCAERSHQLLDMYDGSAGFDHRMDRLSDYVIPGGNPRARLDPEEVVPAEAVAEFLPGLTEEAGRLVSPTARVPPYAHDPEREWTGPVVDWGRWLVYQRGRPLDRNLDGFPATRAFIEKVARDGRLRQLCYLVAQPGLELARHSDGVADCASWHLGLVVPGSCGIRIADEVHEHDHGRTLCFDDSYIHSAWNRSSSARVILSAYFVHPDFRDEEVAAAATVVDELKVLV